MGINFGLLFIQDSFAQSAGEQDVENQTVETSDVTDEFSDDSSDDSSVYDDRNEYSSNDSEVNVAESDSSISPESDTSTAAAPQPIPEDNETSSEMTYEEALQAYMQENGITLTSKDVQYDMQNNLDQNFAILGTGELDTYYNYGFADVESEYFSVDITPFDGEYSDGWNLYFNRSDFSELYNLLKENGEVTIAATGVIPSAVYEDSQDNLALAKQATWWAN